jgi:hypothetical protein
MTLSGQSAPAPAAERVIDVDAKLGEGPISQRLHHAGQAGFGCGIQLPFADARVFEAIRARLPGLWAIEHQHTDTAHAAEMV